MKKNKEAEAPFGKEPFSIPTEQALLGTILLSVNGRDLFRYALASGVSPEHFSYTPHGLIWRALALADQTERSFDPAQIFEVATNQGWGNEIGGLAYLTRLCEYALPEGEFAQLVKQLLQYAHDRRVIRACEKVVHSYSANGDWHAALTDLYAVLSAPLSPFQAPTVYSVSDLLPGDFTLPFLIDPLLPECGLLLLVGAGGVGKSLFTLWLALTLAQGKSLFDRFNTQACTVLYLDGESNARAFKRRLTHFVTQPIDNLLYAEWVGALNTPEGRAQLEYLLRACSPACVILDSLIRFHTLDENKAGDMRLLFYILAQIRQRYATAFIIIHHARKSTLFGSTQDAIRGSTDIHNAADTTLFLRRPQKSNTMTVEIVKLRHGEEHHGEKWRVALNKNEEIWFYEFLGVSEEAESNVEAAEKFILHLLSDTSLTRKELIERARKEGYATRTVDRALVNLRKDGTVTTRKEGRFTVYLLPETSLPLL